MIDFERLLKTLSSSRVDFVIVGGVAATIHGSARLTTDLDVVYDRKPDNVRRLAAALAPLQPYLRGAPAGLPFRWDEQTIRAGLNFTLMTDAGPIDLLGEISGVGAYDALRAHTIEVSLFGTAYRCIDLETLIAAKRAVGRPKDLEVIAELEAIRDESGAR
jgi:predicted nucleotidyltransferase